MRGGRLVVTRIAIIHTIISIRKVHCLKKIESAHSPVPMIKRAIYHQTFLVRLMYSAASHVIRSDVFAISILYHIILFYIKMSEDEGKL